MAVLHGPPEAGYPSLSEALVNIRATLHIAADAGVILPATQRSVLYAAKRLHYSARTYPQILADAEADGGDRVELDALQAWLPVGRVDQKRLDAIAMLKIMRHDAEHAAEGPAPRFAFARTQLWVQAARAAGLLTARGEHVPLWQVLDELLLEHEAFPPGGPGEDVLERLRRTGRVEAVAERAATKQRVLAEHGLDDHVRVGAALSFDDPAPTTPVPPAAGSPPVAVAPTLAEAVSWHTRRRAPSLATGDALARYAESNPEAFARALLRELMYVRTLEAADGSAGRPGSSCPQRGPTRPVGRARTGPLARALAWAARVPSCAPPTGAARPWR